MSPAADLPAIPPPGPDAPFEQPALATSRLVMRPFTLADAPRVRELAGAVEVADTTLTIPHPYPEGAAEEWIALHGEAYARGASATFAITVRETGEMAGAIGLVIDRAHLHAELGYWVGVPYWGRGYCTEAAREVARFALGPLGMARVYACHFVRNPASGAVMRRIGMRREGSFRRHVRKWGRLEDVDYYGLLAGELLEADAPRADDGAAFGESARTSSPATPAHP
jgi:ribosomal-protein-alanine N-acetyltransferase